jgi:hypothetical protein
LDEQLSFVPFLSQTSHLYTGCFGLSSSFNIQIHKMVSLPSWVAMVFVPPAPSKPLPPVALTANLHVFSSLRNQLIMNCTINTTNWSHKTYGMNNNLAHYMVGLSESDIIQWPCADIFKLCSMLVLPFVKFTNLIHDQISHHD